MYIKNATTAATKTLGEITRYALLDELNFIGDNCISAFNSLELKGTNRLYGFVDCIKIRGTEKMDSFINEKKKEFGRFAGEAKATTEFSLTLEGVAFKGISISIAIEEMKIFEVVRLTGNLFAVIGYDYNLGDVVLCACGDDIDFTITKK